MKLVIRVDTIKPFSWLVADLIGLEAQHTRPSFGIADLILQEIPIPDAVVCCSHDQGIALLAFAQFLLDLIFVQSHLDRRAKFAVLERFNQITIGFRQASSH